MLHPVKKGFHHQKVVTGSSRREDRIFPAKPSEKMGWPPVIKLAVKKIRVQLFFTFYFFWRAGTRIGCAASNSNSSVTSIDDRIVEHSFIIKIVRVNHITVYSAIHAGF